MERPPGAGESIDRLPESERTGLLAWLADTYGRPAQALFGTAGRRASGRRPAAGAGLRGGLANRGHRGAERAQGRIEQYLGGAQLDAATIDAYAEAARHVVTELLGTEPAQRRPPYRASRRSTGRRTCWSSSARLRRRRHSRLLRTGFDHRAEEVAKALRAALAEPTPKR